MGKIVQINNLLVCLTQQMSEATANLVERRMGQQIESNSKWNAFVKWIWKLQVNKSAGDLNVYGCLFFSIL